MKLYGKLDGEAITDISYNSKAFEWYDDVYIILLKKLYQYVMFTCLLKKIGMRTGFLIIVLS